MGTVGIQTQVCLTPFPRGPKDISSYITSSLRKKALQNRGQNSPFSRGGGSASGVPGGGPGVWGSGGVAGRAGAGIGGAAGAPSHGGAPGCGWDQTGLLHLCTFQTWRLKSSADMGRTPVSNGLPVGLEASGVDTPLPTFA